MYPRNPAASHCIWNRRVLAVVLEGDQAALLSAAEQWSKSNPGSFLVVPKSQVMECADCKLQLRAFKHIGQAADGNKELECDRCGWLQISAARGAAELCRFATWHSKAEYAAYRNVAVAGGLEVPLEPPNFSPPS